MKSTDGFYVCVDRNTDARFVLMSKGGRLYGLKPVDMEEGALSNLNLEAWPV